MVLDIPGGFAAPTNYLDQWPFWGGTNQQWQLQAIGSTVPPFSGGYVIRSRFSGLYISLNTDTTAYPGLPIVQNVLNSENLLNEWDLRQTNDGYYVLVPWNPDFSLALDVPGATINPGVQMDVWTQNSGPNQEWKIEPTGDGYYTIASRSSFLVLDDSGMSTKAGNPIIQWPYWGGPNQQWELIPVANR